MMRSRKPSILSRSSSKESDKFKPLEVQSMNYSNNEKSHQDDDADADDYVDQDGKNGEAQIKQQQ